MNCNELNQQLKHTQNKLECWEYLYVALLKLGETNDLAFEDWDYHKKRGSIAFGWCKCWEMLSQVRYKVGEFSSKEEPSESEKNFIEGIVDHLWWMVDECVEELFEFETWLQECEYIKDEIVRPKVEEE